MGALKQIPVWLLIAALLTILTIVGHEIAHYIGAIAMGAQDVKFHWADVSYDPVTLDATGEAVMALAGPLITHAIIVWIWLTRASGLAALSLGLGACTRDMLLFPFTLKALLGRDVSTFSGDEVQVATALGISPLPLALVAVVLGWGGFFVFLTRAYRSKGRVFPFVLFFGVILGIVSWNVIGPVLFDGGRGYS